MLGSEKLGHGELLHEAPVVAIRGSKESRAAVGGLVAESELGAGGEGEILSLEDLGGEGGGGDDDAADGAELEAEEGTILGGEGGEGLVEGRREEVEVAEERQRRRAWRKAAEIGGPAVEEILEEESCEEAEDDVEDVGVGFCHHLSHEESNE